MEVALAPTHRRCGIGKGVLQRLFDVGRARHCGEAWVLTYRSNVGAMALYTSVGGTEGADDSGSADALVGYTFSLMNAQKFEPS